MFNSLDCLFNRWLIGTGWMSVGAAGLVFFFRLFKKSQAFVCLAGLRISDDKELDVKLCNPFETNHSNWHCGWEGHPKVFFPMLAKVKWGRKYIRFLKIHCDSFMPHTQKRLLIKFIHCIKLNVLRNIQN